MKLLITTLSLFIFSNALAAGQAPAETRARIVCSQWSANQERGTLIILDQISTLYNDGAEVKYMQGEEFVDENFRGKSPVFEARLFYMDGILGDNPTPEGVDEFIRNSTPTFERFGQMGRIRDSIRYSFGHNGSGAERVTFNVSTLYLDQGAVMETTIENGKTEVTARYIKCMKPYAVEAPTE